MKIIAETDLHKNIFIGLSIIISSITGKHLSHHFLNTEVSITTLLRQYTIPTLNCLNNYKESEYLEWQYLTDVSKMICELLVYCLKRKQGNSLSLRCDISFGKIRIYYF